MAEKKPGGRLSRGHSAEERPECWKPTGALGKDWFNWGWAQSQGRAWSCLGWDLPGDQREERLCLRQRRQCEGKESECGLPGPSLPLCPRELGRPGLGQCACLSPFQTGAVTHLPAPVLLRSLQGRTLPGRHLSQELWAAASWQPYLMSATHLFFLLLQVFFRSFPQPWEHPLLIFQVTHALRTQGRFTHSSWKGPLEVTSL